MVIQSSRFINNSLSSNLVFSQGSLTVVDCLFDGNTVRGSNLGAVYTYSRDDVTIRDSNFTDIGGSGHAIIGYQNVTISNCIFSYCSSAVYTPLSYHLRVIAVYVTDSKFHHCSRSIYSIVNVTVINSDFNDIIVSGGGSVVYMLF